MKRDVLNLSDRSCGDRSDIFLLPASKSGMIRKQLVFHFICQQASVFDGLPLEIRNV